ncbi:MAG: hypothetical protein SWZ49_08560 [Cyanobacteriota bacterium]|nr:hypothetical protein [Cyanobacteriota bacterium]
MNIKLNIEQIILEGVDVPRSQRPRLQAAVSAELSRLLTEKGVPPHLQIYFYIIRYVLSHWCLTKNE